MQDELNGSLIIIKNGLEYVLPAQWAITDSGSYEFNNKLEDKAFVHGSDMVGDGKVKGRTIQVEYDFKCSTEAEHDTILNHAYQQFSGAFNLVCGRTDRMYKVAGVSKVKHQFQKGFKQRWSVVTVSLLLAEPFRYELERTVAIKKFDAPQENAYIHLYNPSSVDVPLVIKFMPDNTMYNVEIKQLETEQGFYIRDTLLRIGTYTTVDGEAGTVRRGTANAINTFNGLFLHAIPGDNTFLYTGDAGTIEISYLGRWFI